MVRYKVLVFLLDVGSGGRGGTNGFVVFSVVRVFVVRDCCEYTFSLTE